MAAGGPDHPDDDVDDLDDLDEDHVYLGDLEDEQASDAERAEDLERSADADVHRAPICGACGVTTLPVDPANVIDTAFACDNEGCEAYGDVLG